MFAKYDWFEIREDAWSVSPRTWQGWAYLSGILLALGAAAAADLPSRAHDLAVGSVCILFCLDSCAIRLGLRRGSRRPAASPARCHGPARIDP